MRPSAWIIGILILLAIVCIIAGCSSGPLPGVWPNKTPEQVNFGFSSASNPVTGGEYRSEMAANALSDLIFPDARQPVVFDELGQNTTPLAEKSPDIHIFSINGNNINQSGFATRWTYGVRHLNRTYILTYDRYGERLTEWNARMPEGEIFLDQIVSPAELIDRNRAVIFTTPDAAVTETRDLALGRGMYSLTISGHGRSRVLLFDAKTGTVL